MGARLTYLVVCALAVFGGCNGSVDPLSTAPPGVVFAFPADGQLDVPTGSRVIVTFSDPVEKSAIGACTSTSGAFCVIGPSGPIVATPEVSDDGYSVSFPAGSLAAATTYQVFVRSELAPRAMNLPSSGPLVTFTTRAARPQSAAPTLVAINGSDPASPASFRPLLETSTIRLVFSEPLDPRTVVYGASAIALVDSNNVVVPARLFASDIHVAIDPIDDLLPNTSYTLRVGASIADLSGQAVTPATYTLTPERSSATPAIKQVLRTRGAGDPGPDRSRSGVTPNEIVIDKPLIGREVSTMQPTALEAELGDPKALDGPIAFTIRRGQRLKSSGMDIALGGEIPAGLSTGNIWIELLTDAGGRIYRNPHQSADQRPENRNSPLYVDLSLDIAIYAEDDQGNAALTQTVLGVQAIGTAIATDGVLAIETVASMDMGLLGVTHAPTNFVLELITDQTMTSAGQSDTTAPAFVASFPGQSEEHRIDDGIDLVFSEPIDLERARNGGLRLEDSNGIPVPVAVESQGAAAVLHPLQRLQYSKIYKVIFQDVADVAGNKLTQPDLSFTTGTVVATDVPMTVSALHPGAACALVGGSTTAPGHCDGGADSDESYRAFTLPADDPVEVSFTQPLLAQSATLGTACGSGSVRIEEVDGSGACIRPVAGTLLVHERSVSFVPDVPWSDATNYRVTLVSGSDGTCGAGELCGLNGPASFDPLNGGSDAGGPALVVPFVGGAASPGTHMLALAAPFSDINGSFTRDASEQQRDENRAALRITGYSGDVTDANFNGTDCVPETPEVENCMFLSGAMPTELGELSTSCGTTGASSCIPALLAPEAMYATSINMTAEVFSIAPVATDTNVTVMRVREPSGGPLMGYIVDRSGTPTLVLTLDLYMDAPDMSLPFTDHDLHSKPLSVTLEGPVTFLADGRIAISLANTADLPVDVNISNAVLDGVVNMIVPQGQMRLQLMSPAVRGGAL